MSKLTREQKESIGLLSIGTFLEYFDLMLYVHMAVILNELFFPQGDAKANQLLTAFAFCSTFVFRPIGALLFGWLGDNIGRKSTIVITTMMMAVSCLIMMTLPTYAQIGISAAWIITFCRALQGISSMGEMVGAEIYFIETIKDKTIRYTAVQFLGICFSFAGFAALGVSVLIIKFGFSWRYAFAFGLTIAIVGTVARTRLREAVDFIDYKRRMREGLKQLNLNNLNVIDKLKEYNELTKVKVSNATVFFFS